MKYVVFFVLILAAFSCNTQVKNIEQNSTDTILNYVILKPNLSPRIDSVSGDTIPIIINYYYDVNIILIDSLPQVYYHIKPFICRGCVGITKDQILPLFIGLDSERLHRIDSSKKVLDIVLQEKELPRAVYLVSNRDTIIDSRYFKLKKALIDKGIRVSTRLLTEEEKNVLQCVLDNRTYNPEDYLWDKTGDRFEIIDIGGDVDL